MKKLLFLKLNETINNITKKEKSMFNKRITELKSRAEEKAKSLYGSGVIDETFCEEFAKLIIDDCLVRIRGTALTQPPDNTTEWESGYALGIERAYTMVKQHFSSES
jgi:hypothetical protein